MNYTMKILVPETDTEPEKALIIKGRNSITQLDAMTVDDGDKIEFIYAWSDREKNEETRRYRWTPKHKWQMFHNQKKIWK